MREPIPDQGLQSAAADAIMCRRADMQRAGQPAAGDGTWDQDPFVADAPRG